MQRTGCVPDQRFGVQRAAFAPVGIGNGRAHTVAVDEGGDDAAVEDTLRSGHVLGSRLPSADGFVTFPITLDVHAVRIEAAAAPTVVFGKFILNGALFHSDGHSSACTK